MKLNRFEGGARNASRIVRSRMLRRATGYCMQMPVPQTELPRGSRVLDALFKRIAQRSS